MYGHAAHTLTACVLCPSWQPRWATALTDDNKPVCTPHAISEIPMLADAVAV